MRRARRHVGLVAAAVVFVAACGIGPALSSSPTGLASVSDYAAPGVDPWGTAFDAAGLVWAALPGCDPGPRCATGTPPGKIAQFDPTSHSWTTVVTLPAGYGQPLFVAVAASGKVWFTMPVTNAIGAYDPVSATVTQWSVPTLSGGPWGLAIDHNGKVWFTEHYVNKIGSFDPGTQQFTEIATPSAVSDPYGITVDAANNVWFTENTDSVALIGEYTPNGVLDEYKIRNTATAGSGLTPHAITLDAAGNPWWSEGWVSSVGTLSLASARPGTNTGVTEYHYTPACSSCGSHTSGIAADHKGQIWLDDSLQNTFGWLSVGGGSFTFYNSPGSHPHDGLGVDSQDRVWFDEEFSNKIAEASPSWSTTTSSSTTSTTAPGAGSALATDTFQRPNQAFWGTASDGQTWGGDANTSTAFSISGNTGKVTNAGTSINAVLGPSTGDADVRMTGSLSAFGSNANIGPVARWTDGNNWYKAFTDGAGLVIQKKVGGVLTNIANTPFPATAGTLYTIELSVVGATLKASIWPASATPPANWMLTVNDTSLTSGRTGMRLYTLAGTATVASFQSGVPSTQPPPPTSTTTTTAAPAGSSLGTDTFQRSNQVFWGTASDGQTWAGDANTSNVFSISGNTGRVTNAGAVIYNAVLGAGSSNVKVQMTGSLSTFANNANIGPVARWTDGNNWYKAFTDGAGLVIQKKVAGALTNIASKPYAATGGTLYTIDFQVVGTTLNASIYPAGTTPPATWMITVNDTSLTSGRTGMRFYTLAGTATVTSFRANSL